MNDKPGNLFSRQTTMVPATVFIFTVLFLAAFADAAEQQNVRPGINDNFLNHPDYQKWVARFERPGREVYDRRKEIVSALGIQAGLNIADIGAGTGLYTRIFSSQTGPTGTVYAVDIASDFINEIMHQAKSAGVKNVVGVVNTQTDVMLDRNSIDLAFICDTYHHFEYPNAMLKTIHNALRPNGSLVIIDFRKIEGVSSNWVMSHTRADKETVTHEVESEGFELTEDRDFLKTNYYLRFTRKSSDQR